jgi:2-polyprenyl-6-methoxyphenol hydroxylase-like FAD-dependent oxidoreductase
LATLVVGAGPAGLLFSIVARLLYERRGGDPHAWPFFLFDKRATYERSHRLRIAPGPYRDIARELQHPGFDAFLAFLEREQFRPEVNRLEERLSALALRLGVRRELQCVGPSAGGVTLAELRAGLEREGRRRPADRLTIVAADSVRSAVRELVGQGATPVERTHQYLARLHVFGDGLPDALGVVEHYKLSKVLASLLDYRLNQNRYGEVDLFLTADEHHAVVGLDATPRSPVLLAGDTLKALRRAPFFRRIVDRFREGFGGGHCEVRLQSTFCLEHRFMERVVFNLKDLNAQVFLIGDAAISCPSSAAWRASPAAPYLAEATATSPGSRNEIPVRKSGR